MGKVVPWATISPPLGSSVSKSGEGLREACAVSPSAPILMNPPLGAGSLANESAAAPRSMAGDNVASLVNVPVKKIGRPVARSEEHTSELQSQSNLVCRLLLEKKK